MGYFTERYNGIMILPPGAVKTLILLWISRNLLELSENKKIIIGVPNLALLDQWINNISIVLLDYTILKISSKINTNEIINSCDENEKLCIITTYSTSYKIADTRKLFDVMILDEIQHLSNIKPSEKC